MLVTLFSVVKIKTQIHCIILYFINLEGKTRSCESERIQKESARVQIGRRTFEMSRQNSRLFIGIDFRGAKTSLSYQLKYETDQV